MKETKTIRRIFYCFRSFGFYPYTVQTDSLRSLHVKRNTGWLFYTTIIVLINFSNVVEVTVRPKKDISTFHGLVTYMRLMLVSLDSLICCTETLFNMRWHVEFVETIAQLDTALRKFQIKASCKRIQFWILVSVLLLASLNIIPQSIFIYDLYDERPIWQSFVIPLQFEIPNLVASVKSLQIIFYAFLILTHLHAFEMICDGVTISEFNQYHNQMTRMIHLFNKCFGWSILVNVTRDFVFFGEGSYLMLTSLESRSQLLLLVMIWSHIIYCIWLCAICHHIHGKVVKIRATGLLIERSRFCVVHRMRTASNAYFSLKSLHNETKFNALGCFDIDLKLLYGFFAFLTNYLMICVQFALAGEEDHFQ